MVARFSSEHTDDCIRLVLSFASPDYRILDAGCGAGRICVPLAVLGMNVTGVDMFSDMINAAESFAASKAQDISLRTGSLLNLPFPSRSFDRIYCFRTFNHLLTRTEQLRALSEMIRVLDVGGVGMVEVNDGESKHRREYLRLHGHGPDGRVVELPVEGLMNVGYIHDKHTLESLAQEVAATSYRTKFVNIAHRRRITLWLRH